MLAHAEIPELDGFIIRATDNNIIVEGEAGYTICVVPQCYKAPSRLSVPNLREDHWKNTERAKMTKISTTNMKY